MCSDMHGRTGAWAQVEYSGHALRHDQQCVLEQMGLYQVCLEAGHRRGVDQAIIVDALQQAPTSQAAFGRAVTG